MSSVRNYPVALVCLPPMEPALPSLGLASLTAYLQSKGVSTRAYGFHLQGVPRELDGLLRKARRDASLFRQILDGDWMADHPREAAILDLAVESYVDRVIGGQAKLVGCSVFRTNSLISLLFARKIREAAPGIRIVFGGPECQLQSNGVFFANSGLVDAVVPGEGEQALLELIEKYSMGTITVPKGSLVVENGAAEDRSKEAAILKMDDLPTPDFTDWATDQQPTFDYLPMAFNRGCTARCKFCAERNQWKIYRQMKVENAVEIIRQLKSTYRVDRFYLTQSLLNGDLRWLSKFCDLLIDEGLNVTWSGNARAHRRMDAGFLQRMFDSGCRGMDFGIESGSDKVLRDMRKGTNREQIGSVLEHSWKAGIWVHTYWIFGYPTETREDLLESLSLLISSHQWIDSARFHGFNLNSSSDLFVEYLNREPSRFSVYLPGEENEYNIERDHDVTRSDFFRENESMISFFTKVLNKLDQGSLANTALERNDSEESRRAKARALMTLLLFRTAVVEADAKDTWTGDDWSHSALMLVLDAVITDHGSAQVVKLKETDLVLLVKERMHVSAA